MCQKQLSSIMVLTKNYGNAATNRLLSIKNSQLTKKKKKKPINNFNKSLDNVFST